MLVGVLRYHALLADANRLHLSSHAQMGDGDASVPRVKKESHNPIYEFWTVVDEQGYVNDTLRCKHCDYETKRAVGSCREHMIECINIDEELRERVTNGDLSGKAAEAKRKSARTPKVTGLSHDLFVH